MLEGASDIHLEPRDGSMVVRFRVDGYLYTRDLIPAELIPPITSRIKIMSGLDIAKSRVPQDGRVGFMIGNKNIDIRASTMPSMYGENVVLRILDKSRGVPSLSELGFSAEALITFKGVIRATKGLILATGPTGSGKTTTICSTINAIRREDKNVMTVEDPIEYIIEGIVQSQVSLKGGVTFADALRSVLRQDPDIIYIGEIRDSETAEIAVRAALTGHLVLSTLHTRDAIGTIARLRDMGIEAGLISDALTCSFAQRLVRKICVQCKGAGCDFCRNMGYKGRIGMYEVMHVNRDIRRLIANNASEDEIRDAARKLGMKSIYDDGLLKAQEGITTLEEVQKVITVDEIAK